LICQLFNQVAIRSNNAVIGAISIRRPSGAKTPIMIVQIPEGTALDDAVRVGFENGTVETLPFYTCNRSGCFARGPVGEPMLNALRAGKQPLRIAYELLDSSAKKQTVTVTLGLDGFATAYERLH
jgi:invasion protein IalB